jgi:prepilin-type N-terminal cleavage/methylation domain-containing protein
MRAIGVKQNVFRRMHAGKRKVRKPSERLDSGFTLSEVMVTLGIIGILSAIAIPVTLAQQGQAANVTTRSDLTAASSAIESALLTWRGRPVAGALNICQNVTPFPSANPVTNTCPGGEWEATVPGDGASTIPRLAGELSAGVALMGKISATGAYCIEASNSRMGASDFYLTSDSPEIREGTCASGEWSDPADVNGEIPLTPAPDLPAAPTGLIVEVVNSVATVSWQATASKVYAVTVSGQPVKTMTAGATGAVTCIFPAATCAGPATTSLPPGTYTATVREQGTGGWGPGASTDFGVSSSADQGLPTAPVITLAEPGNEQVALEWTPPVSNLDGQPVTGYTVFRSTSSTGPWLQLATGIQQLSYTAINLTNGTPYWFRVVASSTRGDGEAAQTATSVTPAGQNPFPTAPVITSASYVENVGGRIRVEWSAPSSSGTSAISSYSVKVIQGGSTVTTVTVNGDATAANISPSDGIALGTTYTLKVTASNDSGAGEASDASGPVTTPTAAVQTQTFTSNGTFAGQSGIAYDLLIVGGGGAGGRDVGGGGSGGQVAYFGGVGLVGNQSVVVGAGGTIVASSGDGNVVGTNGQASSVGAYSAAGGGRGGSTCLREDTPVWPASKCSVNPNAIPGGGTGVANGGGAWGYEGSYGTTDSQTPGTGTSLPGGGSGYRGGDRLKDVHGGGGAGAGDDASGRAAGAGRLVTAGLFAGNTTRYGGGGAGGANNNTTQAGGAGGGGAGGYQNSRLGVSGTANTGGGGGGAGLGYDKAGGAGGSGIVIIKWVVWP